MKVLVTNDDGYHSPLLEPLLDGLVTTPWCSSLRCIVPAENQSWISQAHTRKGALSCYPVTLGAHTIEALNGTPADCVAVGVDSALSDRPDLVISGTNLGLNSGSCFFFSSGTVGGALSAAQYGIKGIALSAHLPREIFKFWNTKEFVQLGLYATEWKRISDVMVTLVGQLAPRFMVSEFDALTVNAPWMVTEQTPVCASYIERALLNSLFKKGEGDLFHHSLGAITRTPQTDREGLAADLQVLERGGISVTALKLSLGEAIPPDFLSEVNAKRKN